MKYFFSYPKAQELIIIHYKGVIIFNDIKDSLLQMTEQSDLLTHSNIIIDFSNCELNLKYAKVLEYADFLKTSLNDVPIKKVAFITDISNEVLVSMLYYSLKIRLPLIMNIFSNEDSAFYWFDKQLCALPHNIGH